MRCTIAGPGVLIAALAAVAASGCGEGSVTRPIDETRTLDHVRPEQTVPVDTRTRMGLNDAPMGAGAEFRHPPMGGAESPAGAPALAWDLPPGWKELAPTPLRTGNFSVPGHDRLECYVTVLPGGGGGVTANLNRWRKQMGLAEMSDADVAALPRMRPVLGADAPLLLMDGTFKGPGMEKAADGFTMAAIALERGGTAIFVKMVGPSADVRAELDGFKSVCLSLRDSRPSAPAATAPQEASPFSWTAPAGWTEGPAKSMRLVTFIPKDAPGVECYVTVLGGAAGGVEANVNRWRGQLHLAPLSADAIASLPTVPVLGRTARMVEIDGGAAGLTGLVCELGAQTVFVKMTGPMDALRGQRAAFVEFCKSLSQP